MRHFFLQTTIHLGVNSEDKSISAIINIQIFSNKKKKNIMTTKRMITIVLAMSTVNLLKTNAVPIPEESSSVTSEFHLKPLGVILFVPELRNLEDSTNYQYDEIKGPFHHRSDRMTRSVLDQDIPQAADDDLETAAGTNLLRPLFVYRQQMAYRERSRKDGRRAAPTYY